MNEDLRWLAENAKEWSELEGSEETLIRINKILESPEFINTKFYDRAGAFTRKEWQAARDELEDERMGIVARNGNDGLHYDTGQKHDTGKPAMHLIPPGIELEVARVLGFGAEKYGPENWRKVPDLRNRYMAAAMRHINAMRQGESLDGESGLSHAAHAICCLMFMGEIELTEPKV